MMHQHASLHYALQTATAHANKLGATPMRQQPPPFKFKIIHYIPTKTESTSLPQDQNPPASSAEYQNFPQTNECVRGCRKTQSNFSVVPKRDEIQTGNTFRMTSKASPSCRKAFPRTNTRSTTQTHTTILTVPVLQ